MINEKKKEESGEASTEEAETVEKLVMDVVMVKVSRVFSCLCY